MKKIVCVFFMVLFLVMNLGMANPPAAVNHHSVPMSSQEMLDTRGGEIVNCAFGGSSFCCCVDVFIFQVCACITMPFDLF